MSSVYWVRQFHAYSPSHAVLTPVRRASGVVPLHLRSWTAAQVCRPFPRFHPSCEALDDSAAIRPEYRRLADIWRAAGGSFFVTAMSRGFSRENFPFSVDLADWPWPL